MIKEIESEISEVIESQIPETRKPLLNLKDQIQVIKAALAAKNL